MDYRYTGNGHEALPYWTDQSGYGFRASMYPMDMYPANDEFYPYLGLEQVYEGPFGSFSQNGGEYQPYDGIPWRIGFDRRIFGPRIGSGHPWRLPYPNVSSPLSGEPEYGVIDFSTPGGGYRQLNDPWDRDL